MRWILGLAGMVVLLSSHALLAQSAPSEMVVAGQDVDVRSGPSVTFNVTSKLRFGDRVTVVQDKNAQGGWVAIKPPPGSFSWIETKRIIKTENKQVCVVVGEEPAPVRPGSVLTNKAPDRESVTLQPGTFVVIVGPEYQADGGTWVMIEAPQRDVRYVLQEALRPAPAVAAVSNPPSPPSGNASGPVAGQFVSGQWPAGPNLNGQTTALYRTGPNTAPTPLSAQPQWSVWGQLRRTTIPTTGQPVYALEDRRSGAPLLYVTTAAGFSLQDYIGKTVALYGPVTYRSDETPRMYYMTASHVASLPR